MTDLSIHNIRRPSLPLRRLPSTIPCSRFSAAYNVSKHDRAMIVCNAWRLTVRTPDVRWEHCIRLICFHGLVRQAFFCIARFQGLDSLLQIQVHIHRAVLTIRVICWVNLCGTNWCFSKLLMFWLHSELTCHFPWIHSSSSHTLVSGPHLPVNSILFYSLEMM